MDEWLSAGDAAFIEKVNSKQDILLTTKILILASHSKS